ncbi:hypothetical protein LINGRAHAP2_LOCUS8132 [Linum grandiflorum]
MEAAIQTSSTETIGILLSQRKKPNSKFQAVRCGLNMSRPLFLESTNRRRLLSVTVSTLFVSQLQFLLPANNAIAGSLLDKYVKRKKLDPLEVYVPAVILTEMQIRDLGKTLDVDEPQFSSCRSLLRSGPAGSLRVNIRAYCTEIDFGMLRCVCRALEELDNLLLQASRNNPGATITSMKAKIVEATNALDSLLNTVPQEVLDKGKAIADAYNAPDEEEYTQSQEDPQLKQLESIL